MAFALEFLQLFFAEGAKSPPKFDVPAEHAPFAALGRKSLRRGGRVRIRRRLGRGGVSLVREMKAQACPVDIAKALQIGLASVYRVVGQKADH
jgi:hypothetical protein